MSSIEQPHEPPPRLIELSSGVPVEESRLGGVDATPGRPGGPVIFDIESQQSLPDLPEPVHRETVLSPDSEGTDAERTDPISSSSSAGENAFWLDGDVVLCGCPDCGAPMTVRIWLMIADCWNCGTSIELSEQQEREVRDLLEKRERQQRASSAQQPPSHTPTPRKAPPPAPSSSPSGHRGQPRSSERAPRQASVEGTPHPPTPPPAHRRRRQRIAAASPNTVRRRLQTAEANRSHAWISELLKQTPAWLISLVFHLVMLTLLGLFTLPEDDQGRTIMLTTAVSHNVRPGGEVVPEDPTDDAKFDLPIPSEARIDDPQVRDAMIRADQDARELRIDPDTKDPHLPDLQVVKKRLNQSGRTVAALAARDPRIRVEMVKQEGGTTLTEAAVARGLRWLAQHQNADGSWSLHDSPHSCACDFKGIHTDAGGTALALLPFLGAGQTHLVGRYQTEVAKGLRYLLEHQKPDGDLRHDAASSNAGMYVHGQAAIVLCEAYLLSGDEQLRNAAQKAIDFIVEAQHPAGGWRYRPGEPGDTSVVGWQLMALQSAKAAHLAIPDFTLELANQFLDSVESVPDFDAWRTRWAPVVKRQGFESLAEVLSRPAWGKLDIQLAGERIEEHRNQLLDSEKLRTMLAEYDRLRQSHGSYAYQPNRNPTHVMTAEALLCRMYLGATLESGSLAAGVENLIENHLPREDAFNIYYWYYGTQAMHHVGGEAWEAWNSRMRDVLVATQRRDGHPAGSWNPNGPHASGGRIYVTALAICTLEVYYRHLPIFRQLDLQGVDCGLIRLRIAD